MCVCMCPGVCAGGGALRRQSRVQGTPKSVRGVKAPTETGQPASTSSTDLYNTAPRFIANKHTPVSIKQFMLTL